MTARRDPLRPSLALGSALVLAAVLTGAIPSGAAEPQPPSVAGSTALALATLVATQDPLVSSEERQSLAIALDGEPGQAETTAPITISATAVTCRSGDVDITASACDLAFTHGRRSIAGRLAHEMLATLREAGVSPDGAAGSSYVAIRDLSCRIDIRAVQGKDGGGAECRFKPDR